ncbi:MAG: Chromosome segregation protein [Verrucomicrobiales bacterium]|nr:Chromosome segregation protein [Verrucomicrobiales bacterium]
MNAHSQNLETERASQRFLPTILRAGLTAFVLLSVVVSSEAETEIQFNRDVRPILSDKCFHCHGPDKSKRKADLRLDHKETALGKSESGKTAIAPGKPEASEVVARITAANEDDLMPPKKSGRTLSPQEIQTLTQWIKQGAKWETHWSFQTPQRPALPKTKDRHWAKNEIDHFILAKLESEKLKPSREASKETLLRRVTLDLNGLPPTTEELDNFLKDKSPNAYEKVVDRLLASPRYGERMVLEWLDAARYADSNGYQGDRVRTMWPWRDWVIDAMNKNMPFDQFTVEQLAGDLLPNPTTAQKIATGFNRNHMLNGEGGRIPEESRVDYVFDRTETTAAVWLGVTLGCARCHDHKYDSFKQKEYFQVSSFFNNVAEVGGVDNGGMANPVLEMPTKKQTEEIAKLKMEIAALEAQGGTNTLQIADKPRAQKKGKKPAKQSGPVKTVDTVLSEPEKLAKKLEKARNALSNIENSVLKTMVMKEQENPRETFILAVGSYDKRLEKVTAGVPASLNSFSKTIPTNRLEFARWIVDPANPLTPRVIVNRYWQQFFGVGIVKTSEDFGVQGEWPIHKELLDWLASEFVRSGWNVKAMHKLIVMSATYRQSSKSTPELNERDPDNRLLARGARFRLPSALLRDQALAFSGLLNEKLGGPPVKPYQPPGLWEDMSLGKLSYKPDKGQDLYRRSLYVFWRRTIGPTMFFDTSARQVCTVRLPRTNTPLHSLLTLNETAYVEAARVLAERIMLEGEPTKPDERIKRAFRLATSRSPGSAELSILKKSFARLTSQFQNNKEAALQLVSIGDKPRDPKLDVVQLAAYTGVANLILNLDEVLNKE